METQKPGTTRTVPCRGESPVGQESDRRSLGKAAEHPLAAAALLARRRRYAEAEKLIQAALDSGGCSEPEALDLRGRMHAQQGHHLHAEACWSRALQLDPSNSTYGPALNRLRQASPSRSRLIWLAVGLVAICAFGALDWQIAARLDSTEGQLFATSATLERHEAESVAHQTAAHGILVTLGERLGGVERRLATMPTTVETAEQRSKLTATIARQIATLERALDERLGAMSLQGSELARSHREQLSGVLSAVDTLVAATRNIEAALRSHVAAREAQTAHGKALGSLAGGVSELGGQIESIQASVSSIARQGTEQSRDANRLLISIQKRVDALPVAGDIATVSKALARLELGVSSIARTTGVGRGSPERDPLERRSPKPAAGVDEK